MRLLGERTPFPTDYSPDLLEGIPRALGRAQLGLTESLPFAGEDIWNSYELTWLDAAGMAKAGCMRLVVSAATPLLVESKSLKLYLGSLTWRRFSNAGEVADVIAGDLANALETVEISVSITDFPVNGTPTAVTYQSELLRSLCPVTGQPDFGTFLLRAEGGEPIDSVFLDEMITEHRDFMGFHEQCAELFFMKVTQRFSPEKLAIGCFYTRRGGIDINPIRRLAGTQKEFLGYWRQGRQ